MKAIMLTIRLWYFYLTYKGIKTVEVRKSLPKNFKGDVYECVSKTNWKKDLMKIPENERKFFKKFVGKVGLKFTLNKVQQVEWFERMVQPYTVRGDFNISLHHACLTEEELQDYIGEYEGVETEYWDNGTVVQKYRCYAWHIDNLVIFDRPKELNEFYKAGHYEDFNDYFTDEKQINGKWCIPLTKAPQSWCYVEVEE